MTETGFQPCASDVFCGSDAIVSIIAPRKAAKKLALFCLGLEIALVRLVFRANSGVLQQAPSGIYTINVEISIEMF
jgi:hypothetical protein